MAAVSDSERSALEAHLAGCPGCRQYIGELRRVTAPFSRWEEGVAHVNPGAATLARWAEDFHVATTDRDRGRQRSRALESFLDWCLDMLQPYRRAWAGLAAVWAVILAVNFATREPARSMALRSRPSPELVRAFLAGERFVRTDRPAAGPIAEPPRVSSPPRSEQRARISRG